MATTAIGTISVSADPCLCCHFCHWHCYYFLIVVAVAAVHIIVTSAALPPLLLQPCCQDHHYHDHCLRCYCCRILLIVTCPFNFFCCLLPHSHCHIANSVFTDFDANVSIATTVPQLLLPPLLPPPFPRLLQLPQLPFLPLLLQLFGWLLSCPWSINATTNAATNAATYQLLKSPPTLGRYRFHRCRWAIGATFVWFLHVFLSLKRG